MLSGTMSSQRDRSAIPVKAGAPECRAIGNRQSGPTRPPLLPKATRNLEIEGFARRFAAVLASLNLTVLPVIAAPDLSLADFESVTFGDWVATGTAFGTAPLREGKPRPLPFHGFQGTGVAGSPPGQDAATGTLTSARFTIQRRYLNFLVWGQRNRPSEIGVELRVVPATGAGEPLTERSAAATEAFDPSRTLHWRTFDLEPFAGRTAQIRVNDHSTSGAIAVDSVAQSDQALAPPTDASRLLAETFRPQFHFTAQSGWLNDANGLLHHAGTWHLFHQHRPPGSQATVWGHAVSADLLHWSHRETAIPNEGPDAIFSGSGLVDEDNAAGLQTGDLPPFLLFYTLHPAGNSGRKATQCLAFSQDGGQTFHKFPGNPLLATRDFNDRDPKALYHRPTMSWLMVLSLSRNNTDREHATYGLFRSPDLKSWELLQEIGPGAWYWECPDLFELPLDGGPARSKWVLGKGSGDYLVGTFDGRQFQPETEPIRTQWGACYYGAQTFSNAPGGRRIQIAWMNSGPKDQVPNAFPGMPFNQQMSFPRELTLRSTGEGPRLFRQPVPEIETLWSHTQRFGPGTLAPGDNPLAGVTHDLLDVELELEPANAKEISLHLRGQEIRYDVAKSKLRVSGRALDLPAPGGALQFRILLDRTSYELFANGGAFTHSQVFFPDPANRRIALEASGGPAQIRRLEVRELRSAVEPN